MGSVGNRKGVTEGIVFAKGRPSLQDARSRIYKGALKNRQGDRKDNKKVSYPSISNKILHKGSINPTRLPDLSISWNVRRLQG